jgi:tetratricopeptide (TPR) repeat protein
MRCIALCCLCLVLVFYTYAQSSLHDGLKFLEQKEYSRAREVFESILKADDANAEAHAGLARVLLAHDRDYDKAEEHLEKAVELNDTNAGYHFYLGNVYGAQAQRAGFFSKISYAKKVQKQFSRAVELGPEDIRYREALMMYYLMAPGIIGGSVEKAKEQAKEILQRKACPGHIAYAQIALYEKNSAWAEQELRQAIHADPKNWRPYHRLGYVYVEQHRYDEAIAQFTQYVVLAPDDANSYDSLGEGYFVKGEIDAAIKQFQKALSVNPKFSASIYNLGRSYEKKNLKSEAVRKYKEYLESEPDGQFADEVKKKVEELSQ